MKRRLTSLCVLVLALVCVLVLPTTAQAAKEGDYTYTVANGEATITGYIGVGGDITIPSELGGYPVTVIGEKAFYCNYAITSIVIPDSVITIGDYAFAGAYDTYFDSWGFERFDWETTSNLTTVVIGNNVQTIGDFAFQYCGSLKSIAIPDSVISIGKGAFEGVEYPDVDEMSIWSNLTSITLGSGLETIGDYAFRYCEKLEIVTIADGLVSLGKGVFADCYALKSIRVHEDNPNFSSDEMGALLTKDKKELLLVPHALMEAYEIPQYVTTIGSYAFPQQSTYYEDNTASIIIPDTVMQIKKYAFYNCKMLGMVRVGNGIKKIEASAFEGCSQLSFAVIPGSITVISKKAFAGCYGLKDVYYFGNQVQWDDLRIGDGNGCFKNAKMSFGKNLKITKQPASITLSNGKEAKLTVKATGNDLTYTWYYKKAGKTEFKKSSVSGNIYPVKMSVDLHGLQLYCEVRDRYGSTAKTNTVTVTLKGAAKITTQPKSATVVSGKTGKLEIKASGSSLKYQWYVKYKGASAFTKVGKSSKTYSFTMASKLDGAQAYCVVKDKYGIEVKSSVVTIKQAAKPKITTQPKNITQVSGKKVSFSVKASGEGLKYQWYYAKKGSSSFKKVSGAKSATYSVKVSSSVNGRKYYCLVTDKYGQTVKSSAATLTMKTVAKITTQPKSVTVKNGSTAKVTIKATGDGLKYQWYYAEKGSSEFKKRSGATKATYSVKMTSKVNGRRVYCVVKDTFGNTVKTKTVTLKMK